MKTISTLSDIVSLIEDAQRDEAAGLAHPMLVPLVLDLLRPFAEEARQRAQRGWSTDAAVALIAEIRVSTVEAPNGQPNGKAEAALAHLGAAIEEGHLTVARRSFRVLCGALSDETKALRIAAEAFFGGDFRKPGAP